MRIRNVVMTEPGHAGGDVAYLRNRPDGRQAAASVRFRMPYGAHLLVDEGQQVRRGRRSWRSGTPTPCRSSPSATARSNIIDLIEGITLVEQMDESPG